MSALTPHEAMVTWGAAVVAAQAGRVRFHAAEGAYAAASRARRSHGDRAGVPHETLFKAEVAAGEAEMRAWDAFYDAAGAATVARSSVCRAYVHAGVPQAVPALDTAAPGGLGWSPGLEDALSALLRDPVWP